jgi:hypothetical protein
MEIARIAALHALQVLIEETKKDVIEPKTVEACKVLLLAYLYGKVDDEGVSHYTAPKSNKQGFN